MRDVELEAKEREKRSRKKVEHKIEAKVKLKKLNYIRLTWKIVRAQKFMCQYIIKSTKKSKNFRFTL